MLAVHLPCRPEQQGVGASGMGGEVEIEAFGGFARTSVAAQVDDIQQGDILEAYIIEEYRD